MSDKLSQLFAYVDRPWKVVAVILFLIFGIAGYIVYDKRDLLIESWMTPDAVGLKLDEVPEALDKLAEESGADLVQIWSVDLPSNSQTFIAARRKDKERPVIPSPRRLPIVVHVTDLKVLVDVMEGHPVCVPVVMTGSPLARRLAERNLKYGCAIPIPPNPTAFVGVIYLAWEERPDSSVESVAVGNARALAGKLATK